LSSLDERFKNAWSGYRQIAAFDGLHVFRREAAQPPTIVSHCIHTRLPLPMLSSKGDLNYPPSSLGMKKISQPSRIGWK
jgi:hypothetical protein